MTVTHGEEQRPVTPVVILGRTYHLRGDGDTDYLLEIAAEVDRRMREVAETTGTADSLKVAILASLNLADDWFQARRQMTPPRNAAEEERLARLAALLDEALAG